MLIQIIVALMVLNISLFARAEDHEHSSEVCSAQDSRVCVHLGYKFGPITSTSEGQFIVHAIPPQGTQIENLAVELWMDMGGSSGHGSSPVQLTMIRPNIYKVSEAYFVMPGEWLVKMRFQYSGAIHQIEIPVLVAQ